MKKNEFITVSMQWVEREICMLIKKTQMPSITYVVLYLVCIYYLVWLIYLHIPLIYQFCSQTVVAFNPSN